MSNVSAYPPERHLLRDLPVEFEHVDSTSARAHVGASPWSDGDGQMEAGVLLTAVDVLCGTVVGRVVAPDWMATSSLDLHVLSPVMARDASAGAVITAQVVRDGRSTVVVDVTVEDARGGRVAVGTGSFARLPRRESSVDLSAFPITYGERSGFDGGTPERWGSFVEALELVDRGDGSVELSVRDYVQNSFGAVNGGVLATLAERAALTVSPPGSGTTDVELHYLRQARRGPVVTRCDVLRSEETGTLVRVELEDTGLDAGTGPVVIAAVRTAVRR
jgi:acyl-coenzyme A thioesterase PaaI-like protein